MNRSLQRSENVFPFHLFQLHSTLTTKKVFRPEKPERWLKIERIIGKSRVVGERHPINYSRVGPICIGFWSNYLEVTLDNSVKIKDSTQLIHQRLTQRRYFWQIYHLNSHMFSQMHSTSDFSNLNILKIPRKPLELLRVWIASINFHLSNEISIREFSSSSTKQDFTAWKIFKI